MASFAGFAPINNPAITVAVILDSAVGCIRAGQISAPVFQRIAQQVLEYLHTPHDVELPPSRQVLLAARQTKDRDLEEGSPDHLGDALEVADASEPLDTLPVAPSVPVQDAGDADTGEWCTAALQAASRAYCRDDPKADC